jgi:hypothetical protein
VHQHDPPSPLDPLRSRNSGAAESDLTSRSSPSHQHAFPVSPATTASTSEIAALLSLSIAPRSRNRCSSPGTQSEFSIATGVGSSASCPGCRIHEAVLSQVARRSVRQRRSGIEIDRCNCTTPRDTQSEPSSPRGSRRRVFWPRPCGFSACVAMVFPSWAGQKGLTVPRKGVVRGEFPDAAKQVIITVAFGEYLTVAGISFWRRCTNHGENAKIIVAYCRSVVSLP